MANEKKLRRDDFVKKVRPNPSSPEAVQLLQGYIGDSPVEGHFRIYFDEHLNNFIEVPTEAILECLPVEKSENPLGGSRVWLKKSTVVTFGDPAMTNRPRSSFLQGDLLTAYANSGFTFGAGGGAGIGLGGNDLVHTGHSAFNTACITNNPPCPTFDFTCHSCIGTCFRTCDGPSCLFTCNPTCPVTCGPIICNIAARSINPDTICTCAFVDRLVPVSRACNVPGNVAPGTFQGQAAGARYSGAFDPYRTGNFGY
ncbi:hypothetical protein [Flavilitoribacter nigricans]|uniref:Uncharacterized protein n=1 Tax=Flavilitoribacter nigricans (strain ATCC 23147 / DSM 23189 / NBRC 102662 / NCIMB 1420 / SS-2) TaxID=1122177 RepID=A0A2D0MY58_FLAN2|nr:hypothetical protein [Flavilitoribacter nigricans]PHN00829.1 hypothetical protein CRP01_40295 [Flavilitoribacter nigricans DSM 23189 = NBRC 102662]